MMLDDLLEVANGSLEEPLFSIKEVFASDFVFEESVIFNCFYCGRYNQNWKCPPHLPSIDYKKMLSEYDHLAFLWLDLPYTDETYSDVRSESSVLLHKTLIKLERHLWNEDKSTAISFIGGSCKLCKNGCGADRCNNPYLSRSPLEATGVNILKTAAKYDIDIQFPPNGSLVRLGLIAW